VARERGALKKPYGRVRAREQNGGEEESWKRKGDSSLKPRHPRSPKMIKVATQKRERERRTEGCLTNTSTTSPKTEERKGGRTDYRKRKKKNKQFYPLGRERGATTKGQLT